MTPNARRTCLALLLLAALAWRPADDAQAGYPSLLLESPFAANGGSAFTSPLPPAWLGDDPDGPRSRLVLLEDGVELGPSHALHDEIRQLGDGRFSHWGQTLYFSSSDGSDPNENGRRYVAEYRAGPGEVSYVSRPTRAAVPEGIAWPLTDAPTAPIDGAPTRIYWYTIDALRADIALTDAGGTALMPHLRAFAEEAVVFEGAYANSSFTKTSTASMFTGLWPSRHRVDHGVLPVWPEGAVLMFDLDARWVTLAECLDAVGYETWTHPFSRHVHSDSPQLQGFAHVDLDSAGAVPFASDATHWFAYEHILGVHGPYAPSEEARARPLDGMPRRASAGDATSPGRSAPVDPATTHWFEGALDDAQLDTLWRAYLAEAFDADQELGRRLDWLRDTGAWDDALVIVTSDHGEAFGEHGFTQHSTHLYEEGVRVPLLVKFPRAHPSARFHGRRLPHRVSLVDVMPTLLEVTGAPVPPYPLDGRSLLAILRDEEPASSPRPVVLRSSFLREVEPGDGPTLMVTEAVIRGDHKAHFGYRLQASQDPDRPFALGDWIAEVYDLEADPHEHHDLAGDERGARWLTGLLDWHRAQLGPPGELSIPVDDLPADTLERLRELGYLR